MKTVILNILKSAAIAFIIILVCSFIWWIVSFNIYVNLCFTIASLVALLWSIYSVVSKPKCKYYYVVFATSKNIGYTWCSATKGRFHHKEACEGISERLGDENLVILNYSEITKEEYELNKPKQC